MNTEAGQAFYLKWRPTSFDELIGQEHVTRTLLNAIKSGRIRHAYLFSGPRGTGKTTAARLLAKALNVQETDISEIDAASNTGVDDVRDLRDKVQFSPYGGQYKVYIIDEVHRFSGNAFDALLKTLEEPPPHAIFVLATTEIDKVPETIKSRCLQFDFRRVSVNEVANRLEHIAFQEGLSVDRPALELIARQGTGSVRDSISLLDQIVADPDEHITVATVQQILGTVNTELVEQIAGSILWGDASNGLRAVNYAVNNGANPRQLSGQLLEYLRNVLFVQTTGERLPTVSDHTNSRLEEHASTIDRARVLRCIDAVNEAFNDKSSGFIPQLPLELAIVKTI